MYLMPPCFEKPFCPFGHNRDTPVFYEKAKFFLFICMKLQKGVSPRTHDVKFLNGSGSVGRMLN